MTQEWADEYNEDYGFYVSPKHKPRRCQNPHDMHFPIFNVHILRSEVSGDIKEIGTHCYQRWRRLQGFATEPWFDEYEKDLISFCKKQLGKNTTSYERRELLKSARRKWIEKQVKKREIKLVHLEMPFENFKTKELADKWAEEHGGYVFSDFWKQVRVGPNRRKYPEFQINKRKRESRHFWRILINPNYSGEY